MLNSIKIFGNLFNIEFEELSAKFGERNEIPLVRNIKKHLWTEFNFAYCNFAQIEKICDVVTEYLASQKSSNVLQFKVTSEENEVVNTGILSQDGIEEIELDVIFEEKARQKGEFLRAKANLQDELTPETVYLDRKMGSYLERASALEIFADTTMQECEEVLRDFWEVNLQSENEVLSELARKALKRVDFSYLSAKLKSEVLDAQEEENIELCQDAPESILKLKNFERTERVWEAALENQPDLALSQELLPIKMSANLSSLALKARDQRVLDKIPAYFKDDRGKFYSYNEMCSIEKSLNTEAEKVLEQNNSKVEHWLELNARGNLGSVGSEKLIFNFKSGKMDLRKQEKRGENELFLGDTLQKSEIVAGPAQMKEWIRKSLRDELAFYIGMQKVQERSRGREEEEAKALQESKTDTIDPTLAKKRKLKEMLENNHEFAVYTFRREMERQEYNIDRSTRDYVVCKRFTEKEPKFRENKSGAEYLREDGFSEKVQRCYEEARKMIELLEKAKKKLEPALFNWQADYIDGMIPEIGKMALCINLMNMEVFRRYSDDLVKSENENVVILSEYNRAKVIPLSFKEKEKFKDEIGREVMVNLEAGIKEFVRK